MTEKSARAGVEATKPNTNTPTANTPTAKTKRFIESSPVVPSRELSDSTHPKFRQAHLAPYKRLIIRVRQAGNNGGAHAGSGRLFVGGSLARAEARTGERHHAGRGEECRHDRRSGHGVAGRDSENVQGQRRRPLQRDGWPLGD